MPSEKQETHVPSETPPPKKLTPWQKIWNGSWGSLGWVMIGGSVALVLYFIWPIFIK